MYSNYKLVKAKKANDPTPKRRNDEAYNRRKLNASKNTIIDV